MSTEYEGWKEVWRSWYPIVEGVFYFCQGFYLTGMFMYLSIFMVDIFKLSFAFVAMLSSALALPIYLKMFPMAFCDRFPVGKYGRRRPYIMMAAAAYAISYGILSTIMEFSSLWVVLIIISLLAWVLADGNFDALTVDVTPPEKYGLMQGVAWGCRGLGAALGGIAFGLMTTRMNWPIIVAIIGLFAVIECFSGILMKEPKITKERLASIEAFKKVLKKRETWIGALYLFLASTGTASFGALGASYFVAQAKIDQMTLGITLSILNSGMFIGSLAIGIFSDSFGTKKALIIGNILAIIACGLLATIVPGNLLWLYTAALLIGIFQGTQMASMQRMFMELSPPEIGGSMFATYASISNAGTAVLGGLTISFFVPIVGQALSMVSVVPYVIIASMMLPFMRLYEPKRGKQK
jgi:MFS family permease